VGDRRPQPPVLRNPPEELLQKGDEALVVKPGQRHGLDAVLEGFGIQRESNLKWLEVVVRPVEIQVLPPDVPLILIGE
jgi:hypothetical protein